MSVGSHDCILTHYYLFYNPKGSQLKGWFGTLCVSYALFVSQLFSPNIHRDFSVEDEALAHPTTRRSNKISVLLHCLRMLLANCREARSNYRALL